MTNQDDHELRAKEALERAGKAKQAAKRAHEAGEAARNRARELRGERSARASGERISNAEKRLARSRQAGADALESAKQAHLHDAEAHERAATLADQHDGNREKAAHHRAAAAAARRKPDAEPTKEG